jgi:TRAP transporter TAXI family solute receptor
MSSKPLNLRLMGTACACGLIAFITGCSSSSDSGDYVTLGTAPVGGAFAPVGNAIASVTNEFKGDNEWKVQSQGTKGSQQNIRMLDKGEIQLGMSNSAISYHAARGIGTWDKKYDIRAVVTLAPNIGLFITKKDSGIKTLSDLKDKRVTVGPAGAGFEMFLGPLLTAHGVNYGTGDPAFTPMNETYSAAVQLLGDDNADAAFMGGAVPTPAVTQACTSYGISFIPYNEPVRQKLIDEYEFYQAANIPAKNKDGKPTYKGQEADFPALNVGSMQLITHSDVDEDLVYQLTKTIWENRKEIAKQHKAANAINEMNAARYTGTDFHPGAIRFYQEIGIWPEESADADPAEASKDAEPAGSAE